VDPLSIFWGRASDFSRVWRGTWRWHKRAENRADPARASTPRRENPFAPKAYSRIRITLRTGPKIFLMLQTGQTAQFALNPQVPPSPESRLESGGGASRATITLLRCGPLSSSSWRSPPGWSRAAPRTEPGAVGEAASAANAPTAGVAPVVTDVCSRADAAF